MANLVTLLLPCLPCHNQAKEEGQKVSLFPILPLSYYWLIALLVLLFECYKEESDQGQRKEGELKRNRVKKKRQDRPFLLSDTCLPPELHHPLLPELHHPLTANKRVNLPTQHYHVPSQPLLLLQHLLWHFSPCCVPVCKPKAGPNDGQYDSPDNHEAHNLKLVEQGEVVPGKEHGRGEGAVVSGCGVR